MAGTYGDFGCFERLLVGEKQSRTKPISVPAGGFIVYNRLDI